MRVLAITLVLACVSGCSIKRMAVNRVGDALSSGGSTFTSDDDPDLVGDAIPFSLKLMESLLAESPRHKGLLLASASGFTQYAYVYVQLKADEVEPADLTEATALRARARRLYLRAHGYALRGLALKHPGIEQLLRRDPASAVAAMKKQDVPLMYWTAASWGAAISLSKDNPDLVADQPAVQALMDRALDLDEAWNQGAIHSFLIGYEASRIGGEGDPSERARGHFDRVMELSKGELVSPLVSMAEAAPLAAQDKKGFVALLNRALAIDPDARLDARLENLVMQRRARWLLSRLDSLFLE
jgi:predicted anti-sigma-YlaC factor YlaD